MLQYINVILNRKSYRMCKLKLRYTEESVGHDHWCLGMYVMVFNLGVAGPL